ncbi:DUF308 domain-containing protein [Fodinicola acaciae]|uniref:DUF308 domain-containing protein n=1 Tax=Fodinicola acaciae TaxID=2681555 RepID=UPI0013CFD1E6|nr:DUF308 domain-containing protein [Fodinicola acaciae]
MTAADAGRGGNGSRGRRDNGLSAAKFTPAADVDPRVGEHLLDVLGLAGIAAYLIPSSDLHPITRTTTLPSRPTDRLWVDERHLEEAKALIGRLDVDNVPDERPRRELDPKLDVEAAWAQIVAGWDDTAEQSGSARTTELTVDTEPTATEAATEPAPVLEKPPPEPPRPKPAPIVGLDVPFDPNERVVDPEDEGYVPPAPPPLPRLSKYTALALLLVALGLLLVFFPNLLPINEYVVRFFGLAGVVSGFAIGIYRMRDRDDDDPYDDGAQV